MKMIKVKIMNRIKGVRHFYRAIILFIVNHILVGTWFYKAKRVLLNSLGYQIGKETRIVGPFFCTAQLTVGDRCWIGRNFKIHGNGKVTIGDNCDIAPEVVFLTGGHQIGDEERRAGKGTSYTIHIGNGTWIGARSTILKDVNVGPGCVIASCACVVDDVEDNCLVGGVPAKKIKSLDAGN